MINLSASHSLTTRQLHTLFSCTRLRYVPNGASSPCGFPTIQQSPSPADLDDTGNVTPLTLSIRLSKRLPPTIDTHSCLRSAQTP